MAGKAPSSPHTGPGAGVGSPRRDCVRVAHSSRGRRLPSDRAGGGGGVSGQRPAASGPGRGGGGSALRLTAAARGKHLGLQETAEPYTSPPAPDLLSLVVPGNWGYGQLTAWSGSVLTLSSASPRRGEEEHPLRRQPGAS